MEKPSFILVSVLLGIVGIFNWAKADSRDFHAGQELVLSAYKNNPTIYLRVEGGREHPYLGKYYMVSFHGVCVKMQGLSGVTSASYGSIAISQTALSESVASNEVPQKENSLKCSEQDLLRDLNEWHNAILLGSSEVMITPIHSSLPPIKTNKFMSIIHN